ncbi:MAG: helicase [Chitinophagia bacterium]|nr:helicase [Chitinophagia bacterium]
MQFKIYTIPITGDSETELEMNRFLQTHRIIDVDHRLCTFATSAYWSFNICYIAKPPGNAAPVAPFPKKDYKELLTEPEFAIFTRLRAIRKQIAHKEGVAIYHVFTNEELAQMSSLPELTLVSLQTIHGIAVCFIAYYKVKGGIYAII